MFYKGKCVWIIGASSGIGKAIAIELSLHLANIIISSRNEDELSRVKMLCEQNGACCSVIPLDLMDIDSFTEKAQQAYALHHRLDFLFLNGGISQRSLIKDTPLSIDRKLMEINFFGHLALAKAVLPFLIQQQFGHIAVTSSIVGVFGFPMRSAYAASKHALHGFFDTLRAEHQKDHIEVTIIIPGRVKTNISLHALDKDGNPHHVLDKEQAEGMTAHKAAQKILIGIKRKKKVIHIGGKEILMVYIKRYFPFLYYKIVNKVK